MANYGTFTSLDTLATLNNTTVAKLGEDTAWAAVDAALAAHNAIMADLMTSLVETTTDRLRRYGGPANMAMDEIDELGTPDAQKIPAGSNVGFPLRLYGGSLQWTRKAFQNMMASEFAAQVTGMMDADKNVVIRQIKRAIYTPTNVTFADRLVDGVSLPVKALVNADSAPIPLGPNGEVFNAASHTHYLFSASFVAANLSSLISTVTEHYGNGNIIVCINQADEAAIRAFTGFVAYIDPRLMNLTTAITARDSLDNLVNIYNRRIGLYQGAEIWVKPWVIAGYPFCYLEGQPKPLVMRTRPTGGGDLSLVFEDEEHPLRARTYEREFGIGVWSRTNGAVLDNSHGSYTAPTIT
jgi:hypothetical protein